MTKRLRLPQLAWAEPYLLRLIEGYIARQTYPKPDALRARHVKIVAHRGAHDVANGVLENTIAAFDRASMAGIWGLEMDVRWTKDGIPVILHDVDLKRVFGLHAKLSDMSWQQLHQLCPAVPSLADVVARYGGKLHLALELKIDLTKHPHPLLAWQNTQQILEKLTPKQDYHWMALNWDFFDFLIAKNPALKAACLPIARTQGHAAAEFALEQGFAGSGAQYLFMYDADIAAHHAAGQLAICGLPCSIPSLYREIARNMDWIVSDYAVLLQAHLDQMACHSPHKNPS